MRFSNGIGVCALASLAGCGSSSAAASADTAFTLTVFAPGPNGTTTPISGAAVAVDAADGARHEAVTLSNGTATFANLDTTVGTFSFTVFAQGFVAVTDLGLTQGGAWKVTLSPFGAEPTLVDVAGVVRGKQDADDFLLVSASVPSSSFDGVGPEYAIRVEPSAPFSLVVSEVTYGPSASSMRGNGLTFKSWAQFTSPAVSNVTSLDLALPGALDAAGLTGQSLMPSTAQGTLQVPASMAGARGGVFVSNVASSTSMYLGAATSVELAPDGMNLVYEAEWVSPVSDLVTFYSLTLDGASSFVRSDLVPGNAVTFLDPPSIPSPLPLYGDVVVKTVSAPPELWLNILRDGESTVWRVYQHGTNPDAFHLPRLPSSVDPRLVLGTGSVLVVAEACAPGADGFCAQYATGTPATLVSP